MFTTSYIQQSSHFYELFTIVEHKMKVFFNNAPLLKISCLNYSNSLNYLAL